MKKFLMTACIIAGAGSACADQVQIAPSADTTLYSESNSVSNGAGQHMFSGATAVQSKRRALVRFDIAASVPAGSTITNITLDMKMSRSNSGPMNVMLNTLTSDWGEGTSDAPGQEGGGAPATANDATWANTFFPGQTWLIPGGDFVAIASASTSVGGFGFYSWSSAQMAVDAQAWLDNPAGNFGWIILGQEGIAASAKRFDTRNNPTPANRPVLTITYNPPSCQVDLNNDGSVDVLDFFAFISLFNSGDLQVDFNNDGNIDVLDFFAFIAAFNAGCP